MLQLSRDNLDEPLTLIVALQLIPKRDFLEIIHSPRSTSSVTTKMFPLIDVIPASVGPQTEVNNKGH